MLLIDKGRWSQRGNYVYAITNTRTGASYVGLTRGTLSKRMGVHRSMLHTNKHPSLRLQGDFDRSGDGAFVFELLEVVQDGAHLEEREQYWMQVIRDAGWPLYN